MNRRTDIPEHFITHSAQEGTVTTNDATPAPKKSRKVLRGLGWTAALITAFTLGAGINSGGETTAEPLPAETVTETVTETETVEVTPAACVTAIERADEILYLAGEGFNASADAMDAFVTLDVAAIEDATYRLADLNTQVTGIDYRTPADECVAGAR